MNYALLVGGTVAVGVGVYFLVKSQTPASASDSAGVPIDLLDYGDPTPDFPTLDESYMPSSNLPKGIRNNNPGNIRYDGTKWQGLAYPPQDNTGFCVFSTMTAGCRAMAIVLGNYAKLYKLHTVRGIITRWAPPTENDTGAYITDVSRQLGVKPDDSIDLSLALPDLISAIITHENGASFLASVGQPNIDAGVASSGVV